jgi:hypothetical protein
MGAISGESRNKDGQSGNEVFGCGVELDRKEAEYIELMASGGLQFAGTSTFTLEMWMMPKDVAKVYTLISKYNRGKWGQYMVRLQPGMAFSGTPSAVAPPPLPRCLRTACARTGVLLAGRCGARLEPTAARSTAYAGRRGGTCTRRRRRQRTSGAAESLDGVRSGASTWLTDARGADPLW